MAHNERDILGQNIHLVNNDFVLLISPTTCDSIDKDQQESCKVLKFTSNWNFEEILSKISKLETQNYPNLFIFVIDVETFGFLELGEEKLLKKLKILKENLLKFTKNRPVLLQLKSEEENVTKFYFKEKNSEKFTNIEEPTEELKDFEDFPSFLRMFLNGQIKNLDDEMLKKLQNIESSSLILRFLRVLEIPEEFFKNLIYKYIESNSKLNLLDVLDKNFEENDEIHESKVNLLTEKPTTIKSIIKIGIRNGDQKLVKFIMKNFRNELQILSFLHQRQISSKSFRIGQIEMFCNFIESLDFPFPCDFDVESVTDERLREIVKCRNEFFEDILVQNVEGITKFLQNNPMLINIYNLNNEPAIIYAIRNGKFQSFSCIVKNLPTELLTENFKNSILKFELFELVNFPFEEMKDFELYITSIIKLADEEFIQNSLKLKTHKNIIFKLINTGCKNIEKFRKFFKILQKYLSNQDIIELIMDNGFYEYNLLEACVKWGNSRMLAVLLKVLKEVFDTMNCPEKFMEVVKQINHEKKSFLTYAALLWKKEDHQTLWRVLLNIFEDREELKEFVMQNDISENNFVHNVITYSNNEVIEFTFRALKNTFSANQLNEFLKSKGNLGRNLLQVSAINFVEVKKHQILWQVISTNIKNHEELMSLIMENDQNGNNFIHYLLSNFSNEIFEFTFSQLKEYLRHDQYAEILLSKGQYERNLLQKSVTEFKFQDIKSYQILWNIYKSFFKTDEEFVKFLKEVDEDSNNIFHLATIYTSKKVFEFIINELEKLASNEEIGDILGILGMGNNTLLHSAARNNESVELHKYLWTIMRKYFNLEKILNILKCINDYGYCILLGIVEFNTNEVLDLTWMEIKNIFDKTKIQNILRAVNNEQVNIFHILLKIQDFQKFEFLSKNFEKYLTNQQIRELLNQKTTWNGQNILHMSAKYEIIETHEILWEFLLKIFKDRQDLSQKIKFKLTWRKKFWLRKRCGHKKYFSVSRKFQLKRFKIQVKKTNQKPTLKDLILAANLDGNNFIHYLVTSDYPEIIEFSLTKIKENFNVDDYKEILKSKGLYGRNLLQTATCLSKNIKTLKFIWKFFRDFCNTDQEFLEFLKKLDDENNNVFHIGAYFTTKEILEFMINELEEIATNEEIKNILKSLGMSNRNLLQSAALQNEYVELHEYLWLIMRKYFNSQEILDMIKHTDEYGLHLLIYYVIEFNTKEILDLTLSRNENLKFMIKNYEEIISKDEIQNILSTLGYCNENILHAATRCNNSLELHRTLWEIIEKYFNSTEILEMINYCNSQEDTFQHNAVFYNTKEIAEFTWTQIKKFIQTKEDQTEYLSRKGHESHSLLQMSKENKSEDPEINKWIQILMDEYQI